MNNEKVIGNKKNTVGKKWISKHVKENAWGKKFTRWYIIAPSGNCYFFFRGCSFSHINLEKKIFLDDVSKMSDEDYLKYKKEREKEVVEIGKDYLEAMKYIKELEKKGGMGDSYNNDFKKLREYNILYCSGNNKNISYCW